MTASRPTYADIARRAGVGVATVERVLNARGGVRPAMVEKVIAAARALDHPRRLPEAYRGLIRIEVLLVRPETHFFARLSRAFERLAATLDRTVVVHRTFLDEHDPGAIAARICAPGLRRAGLILAAPDHPRVRAAVDEAGVAGLPVVQIVNRITAAADYVGIDNYAAGRTAALLLAGMARRAGRVVALCHSPIYQGHRDRIRGFSDYLAQHPRTDLAYAHVFFGRDERTLSADLLARAFALWPDLVGFYNAGGANGALCTWLRREPRGRALFFVGHELTEASAAALREGVMDFVLDQAPEAQAQRAIELMLARLGLLAPPAENRPIRFITFSAENL
ncbi:MAG: LacI family DNA-binding transcriptional regulator [Acetobacteraceae bacterium]